jgi:hypothetical protein
VSLHWPLECWSPSSSSCPRADWKGYLGHRTGLYSSPEYAFDYPNGDRVQPSCSPVRQELFWSTDHDETTVATLARRYIGSDL